MKFLLAVYSHPEYYPPTLNAIGQLSEYAEKVTVLSRNVKPAEWEYPQNVSHELSGKFKSIRDSEKENSLWKFISFLQFTFNLYKLIKKQKIDWVICYDPIPLLSFRIIRIFLSPKVKLWYHNHDILELKNTSRFSISRMAVKNEKTYFNKIDIFSLPADERREFFPVINLKGAYFFIPNYPSLKYIPIIEKEDLLQKEYIDFIFQGSISYNHGLEDILKFIPELNEHFDKKFRLILKGFINPSFKEKIIMLSNQIGDPNSLKIIPVGPYKEVFTISSQCDIGLAIHTKTDTMNKTLGTSSNKIYEYAAVGLPTILFDNEHFKKHLQHRNWAFFTDLTRQSLLKQITFILENYSMLTKAAKNDFKRDLNFELHFSKVLNYIIAKN